jgi:asparaginyl-tRNA synthetase
MPHMRPRLPFNSLLLRLRSQSIAHLTEFFANREFVQTHPPIITSSDCEGAGEVFKITTDSADGEKSTSLSPEDDGSFFRAPKYLTVSSQLHLEALAQSVGKVWTLSPTFRAERSDTSRHLSEFYMLEAEVSFVDELSSVMDLTEDMLRHMVTKLYNSKVGEEIIHGNRTGANATDSESVKLSAELESRWQGIMNGPWPRVTYAEAVDILQKSGQKFKHKPVWGAGLQAEHERFIASSIGRGGPVFVTNYPREIKPFYMLPSAESPESNPTVDCFDLLVPEFCEIAGGSMREYRLPELLKSMRAHGLIKQDLQGDAIEGALTDDALGGLKWYVDLRMWGSVPHGGFGLGFDRILGYLSGVPNIRDVVAFPRWVGRCDC